MRGDMRAYIEARLPLIYVFLSGIGFSLQTLIIKVITEQGFKGSFQCVFLRGSVQLLLGSYFVYYDEERLAGKGPNLFGNTLWVRLIILLRSLAGFGSIAFAFLAVELIPIGDSTVLIMLSPLLASIMSYIFLGEAWRLPEFFGTTLSLVGAVMVAKPPLIFGGHGVHDDAFYRGVTFALLAACCAACAFIFVRLLGTTAKMPWANVCFAQAVAQIVLSVPSLYISGQHLSFDITMAQFGLLFTGGLIGAVSQILMTIGMQREKSAAATAMRMSDVACGFLWQVLFTADPLSLLSLGGAVLITCSILVIVVFKEESSGGTGPTSKEKAVELRELTAAVHSLADSMRYDELQRDMDMELGFQDSDEDVAVAVANPGKGTGTLRNPSAHGGSRTTTAAKSDVGYDSDSDVFDSNTDDPVTRSFLARMVQSPIYAAAAGGARGGGKPGHQYSSLAQGET